MRDFISKFVAFHGSQKQEKAATIHTVRRSSPRKRFWEVDDRDSMAGSNSKEGEEYGGCYQKTTKKSNTTLLEKCPSQFGQREKKKEVVMGRVKNKHTVRLALNVAVRSYGLKEQTRKGYKHQKIFMQIGQRLTEGK